MVSPITGPFSTGYITYGSKGQTGDVPSANVGQNADAAVRRISYRQKKPYTLPLPFDYSNRWISKFSSNGPGWNYRTYAECAPPDAPFSQDCYNQAYDRFKSKLGESASLAVSVLERREAVDMIVKRSMQIYRFTKALKKLDFKAAAKELGVKQPPRRNKGSKRGLVNRRGAKALSSNYLEFHFGWSPLVGDIGNSIDILQGGVPPYRVSGRARTSWSSNSSVFTPGVRTDNRRTVENDWDQMISIRAEVSVSNPNLWLANQMGFVNPAAVAWEAVPFSFVVDWFANVGDILSSYTDFAGLNLTKVSVTTFSKVKHKGSSYTRYWGYNGVVHTTLLLEWNGGGAYCVRTTGSIPRPKFAVKPFQGFSVRRGLAAISLLVQQLRGK